MSLGLVCASHAPLFDCRVVTPDIEFGFRDAYRRLGMWVEAFDPDLVIHFWPDHFNSFFYDVMPSFCLGTRARALGDWGTTAGPVLVDETIAIELFSAIRSADIDIALSHHMAVDHGFMQIWDLMVGSDQLYPAVPIFINCAAPPLPAFHRVRLLGEAIGRYAAASGKRILLSGSGGLSHDPPIPNIETAPPEQRELLIDGRNPSPASIEARMKRVIGAAREGAKGDGTCLPPDPGWDRQFLELMTDGNTAALDDWSDDDVRKVAGCGGGEVRTWLAAFAALGQGGDYDVTIEKYEVVPGWLTGMGLVRAATKIGKDA